MVMVAVLVPVVSVVAGVAVGLAVVAQKKLLIVKGGWIEPLSGLPTCKEEKKGKGKGKIN